MLLFDESSSSTYIKNIKMYHSFDFWHFLWTGFASWLRWGDQGEDVWTTKEGCIVWGCRSWCLLRTSTQIHLHSSRLPQFFRMKDWLEQLVSRNVINDHFLFLLHDLSWMYGSGDLAGGAGGAVHPPERSERGAKRAFQGGAKISLMFNWAIWRPSIRL